LIPSILKKMVHLFFCLRKKGKIIFFDIPLPTNMASNCF
jgi:hypothetical protein